VNGIDEGDDCPDCGKGRMEFAFPGECGCFTCPPCWSCTNSYLECSECGWRPEDEDKLRDILDKGVEEWEANWQRASDSGLWDLFKLEEE
jgi:hypothetical protein